MKTGKIYIKGTAAYDLSEEEVNNHVQPEVVIVADKGEILFKQSYDVQNVQTGAVYRNISKDSLIFS